MIIDMHIHPIFYEAVCKDKEELEFRKNAFGVFKQSDTSILYMVASDFELDAIIKAIKESDPKAFIEISTVERVEGNYRQKPLE